MELVNLYDKLVADGKKLTEIDEDLYVMKAYLIEYRTQEITKKTKRLKVANVISAPAYLDEAIKYLRLCVDRLKKEMEYVNATDDSYKEVFNKIYGGKNGQA